MKLSIFVLHLSQQHVNLNTTCAKSLFSRISRFTGYQVCFDPLSLFISKEELVVMNKIGVHLYARESHYGRNL